MQEQKQGEQQSPAPPPVLLEWQFDRWQAEFTPPDGGPVLIWMDDSTFRRYVSLYLTKHYHHEPTWEDQQAAVATLRRVRYWLNRKVDADVHIRQFGYQSPSLQLMKSEVCHATK